MLRICTRQGSNLQPYDPKSYTLPFTKVSRRKGVPLTSRFDWMKIHSTAAIHAGFITPSRKIVRHPSLFFTFLPSPTCFRVEADAKRKCEVFQFTMKLSSSRRRFFSLARCFLSPAVCFSRLLIPAREKALARTCVKGMVRQKNVPATTTALTT
jgi:hypothetical protein